MNAIEPRFSQSARELRDAFDRSFAERQNKDLAATDDFLAIRVGPDPYALRLSEVAGLYADKPITGVPSRFAELRGVAGFRGLMVPVYDLAGLLGLPSAETPRWLIIAAAAPVALTFDAFDRHFRVASGEVAPHAVTTGRQHVREIVRGDDGAWPIVHLPSIVEAIKARMPAGPSQKEQ